MIIILILVLAFNVSFALIVSDVLCCFSDEVVFWVTFVIMFGVDCVMFILPSNLEDKCFPNVENVDNTPIIASSTRKSYSTRKSSSKEYDFWSLGRRGRPRKKSVFDSNFFKCSTAPKRSTGMGRSRNGFRSVRQEMYRSTRQRKKNGGFF